MTTENKVMKTKILLTAALLGAAALTANAGVHFGFSIGLPASVAVSMPVAYTTPALPAPVTVVRIVPPGSDPRCVWVGGHWSNLQTGRAWVPGAWRYRPAPFTHVNERQDARDWHDGSRGNDRHDGHDRDNARRHDGYRR